MPGLEFLWAVRERVPLLGVVSQPDRPQGRGKRLRPNPVSAWALERGLELRRPERPDAALAEWLRESGAAVALVMAYGHFLPKSLREAPPGGMVNFHGSILPAYRGASPVETAIACGDRETGLCLMRVVREMDAGGVADCERLAIGPTETAPELRARVGGAAAPLLERNLGPLLAGELDFVPQEPGHASFCRKLRKEDGAIDFELTAEEVYDRWRAFQAWPGAYFDHEGTRVRVGRMERPDGEECGAEAGRVLAVEDGLTVATGRGAIRFVELQRPGGKILPAADFLRGYPIAEGGRLTGGRAEPLVRPA